MTSPAKRGDLITAALMNKLILAAEKQQAGNMYVDGSGAYHMRGNVAPDEEIWVKNNTGSALTAFSIVKCASLVASPVADLERAKRQIIFVGTTPGAATDVFGIVQHAISAGSTGIIKLSGLSIVSVNVSDTSHTHVVPVSGHTGYLASAESGSAELLWQPGSTGTSNCLIRFGIPTVASGPPKVIKVYNDGGKSGGYDDQEEEYTTCNYTYEVREVDGTTVISTDETPAFTRIANVRYVTAADGTLGLWDPVSERLLIAYNERPASRTDCPE